MGRRYTQIERLIRIPRMSSPCVSPDTHWVAWTWSGTGNHDETYIAPTSGQVAPLRVGTPGAATRAVSWAPDSLSLLVEREHNGNERVWLSKVALRDPKSDIPVTSVDPSFFLRGGSLHPDGRTLVYGANVELVSGKTIEPTCVICRNLSTGEDVELARPLRGGENVPLLSPAGDHVVYFRSDSHPAGIQVWLVSIDGREDVEIFNAGDDLVARASWFPDGKRVLLLSEVPARTHRRLGILTLATASVEWLIDDASINIESAYVPANSGQIVALIGNKARTSSCLIDSETGSMITVASNTEELILLAPLDEDTWVAQINATAAASEIVRLTRATRSPRRESSITRSNPEELDNGRLGQAESLTWKSVDGLEIQGWLYRACGRAKGTIVCVHGGPTWHQGDAYHLEAQAFWTAGFNVLVPNYRGSTGFSLSYQSLIMRTGWGGLEQDDIRTGIEALLSRGIANPGEVGITGLSYGGYSTWHAVTHFPLDLVAAGAPICGMTDLVMDYELTRPDLRPLTARMMGGTPSECLERYTERSPIHRVDQIKAPLLIVQGMRDPNVPADHVCEILPQLDDAGVDFDVIWLEDEGHGIAKPSNILHVLSRMLAFFESSLSGQRRSKEAKQ